MQDPSEEVHICAMNGLRCEEVVRHELDSIGYLGWCLFLRCEDDGLEVLDYE